MQPSVWVWQYPFLKADLTLLATTVIWHQTFTSVREWQPLTNPKTIMVKISFTAACHLWLCMSLTFSRGTNISGLIDVTNLGKIHDSASLWVNSHSSSQVEWIAVLAGVWMPTSLATGKKVITRMWESLEEGRGHTPHPTQQKEKTGYTTGKKQQVTQQETEKKNRLHNKKKSRL